MKRIIQGLVLATLVTTAQASPFPGNGDPVPLPAEWTYADRHAVEPGAMAGGSFGGDGELVALPARSTYADRHAGDANTMTGSAFPIDGDGELIPLPARSTYADRFATERVAGGSADEAAALSE